MSSPPIYVLQILASKPFATSNGTVDASSLALTRSGAERLSFHRLALVFHLLLPFRMQLVHLLEPPLRLFGVLIPRRYAC